MDPTERKSQPTTSWIPDLPKVGPEVKELTKFHFDGTWTGKVEAGGMGPGSPEMLGKGTSKCEWIQDGLWLSCDFEQDQFAGGRKVLTWYAKWIIGWDARVQEYRAAGVDSNGNSFLFGGKIEGDRLVMVSLGDAPVKLRFVWDISESRTVRWRNEMSVSNGPWQLIEEYVIVPND